MPPPALCRAAGLAPPLLTPAASPAASSPDSSACSNPDDDKRSATLCAWTGDTPSSSSMDVTRPDDLLNEYAGRCDAVEARLLREMACSSAMSRRALTVLSFPAPLSSEASVLADADTGAAPTPWAATRRGLPPAASVSSTLVAPLTALWKLDVCVGTVCPLCMLFMLGSVL